MDLISIEIDVYWISIEIESERGRPQSGKWEDDGRARQSRSPARHLKT